MCDESIFELPSRKPLWWQKFLDRYLWVIDFVFALGLRFVSCIRKKSDDVDLSHPLVEPNSRMLVRVTTAALFLVFAIILCSCAQSRRELSPSLPPIQGRRPSATPMREPTSATSSLYTKRESVIIKKRETGSPTGSLWADARQSRELFAEERPSKVGDVVTISIPEDLRYAAPSTSAGAAGSAGSAGSAGTAAKGASDKNADGSATAGNAPTPGVSTGEPMKEFRMEIVAVESSGDMYLRGVREYNGQSGKRMIAVNAKIPRRKVRAGTMDARELTGVTVNEDSDGILADYQAPGWDRVVSRKISGFVPDVNSELASVEDARKELEASREALRQQQQSVQEERDRLLKERARMARAAEGMNLSDAQENQDGSAAKDAKGAATAKGAADSKVATAKGASAKSDSKDANASAKVDAKSSTSKGTSSKKPVGGGAP